MPLDHGCMRSFDLALQPIISFDHKNHQSEFFNSSGPVQDGNTSNRPDEPLMNINLAIACMIVVSFAIALGHT